MFTFLLVLLVLDSLVLIGAILLQSGKGNGLAASFGGVSSSADSLLGTRQAGNLLTKTSWWGGALFLLLSLVLSIASSRRTAPKSVLDQAFTQPVQSAPAPVTSGAAPGAAAGVPLTPAPSAPAATGGQTSVPAAAGGRTTPAEKAPAAPATTKP